MVVKWVRIGSFTRCAYTCTIFYCFMSILTALRRVEGQAVPCDGIVCVHGYCVVSAVGAPTLTETSTMGYVTYNKTCVCDDRWSGPTCEVFTCSGRMTLTSSSDVITDGTGNYTTDTKCTWLIIGSIEGVPIRFNFSQFATECGWDHLYIFDGSSAYSPLIGALSGLVKPVRGADGRTMNEITTTSNYAYLHFYSDAAYSMSGFNITFTQLECPSNCSGRGECKFSVNAGSGTCQCNDGWTGRACNYSTCPNNCSFPTGGQCVNFKCDCAPGFTRAPDCSVPDYIGAWNSLHSSPVPMTSHGSVVIGKYLWVMQGYNFEQVTSPLSSASSGTPVFKYDLDLDVWTSVEVIGNAPALRYGHSVVANETVIYMYGGVCNNIITNELWSFDTITHQWSQLNSTDENSLSLDKTNNNNTSDNTVAMFACMGHTAHMINGNMYVIFGYNSVYSYLSTVQVFNLESESWSFLKTTGAIIKGGFGHTSVYDSLTNRIIVHGGYVPPINTSSSSLTDGVYSLNILTNSWTVLIPSAQYKYLHSAVILNRLMIVYGGNTHNDTSTSQGAKCYAADLMVYDLDCNTWARIALMTGKPWEPTSRFGHSASVYGGSMIIFAGFNGVVLSDLYKFTPGNCLKLQNVTSCGSLAGGMKCAWHTNNTGSICSEVTHPSANKCNTSLSTNQPGLCERERSRSCQGCTVNVASCDWCTSNQCLTKCSEGQFLASNESQCLQTAKAGSVRCFIYDNCQSCALDSSCVWNNKRCEEAVTSISLVQPPAVCDVPSCSSNTQCQNCTQNGCMWCSNEGKCVDNNSYVISFPYGQCLAWTTRKDKCAATQCAGFTSCSSCMQNPYCGWCNDASNTGLGTCLLGTRKEAFAANQCGGTNEWFFETCPVCQCNGHSTCNGNTSECTACAYPTTGLYCDGCQVGYWGDPTAGENCSACDCNNQADTCNSVTGVCNCFTRGVIGDKCQECDKAGKYFGDPTKPGGTCYYELAIDWIFTFNLTNDENKSHTHINFLNTPPSPDKDVDFSVKCLPSALMNLTVKTAFDFNETVIESAYPCDAYIRRFSAKDYQFGSDFNTTFYIYIYNFHTPFVVVMSFSQTDQLDLIRFFLTFFSCFFSLLLIAFVAWKLKQRYDAYRRGQRRMQEMQEMASRPFATCMIDIEPLPAPNPNQPNIGFVDRSMSTAPVTRSTRAKGKKECKVSPISLEPLFGHKAAVLSVIILLPRGDEDYTLPDQCGVAIGSALVTLGGHSRRSSVEQASKSDRANKQRKHISNSSNSATPSVV